MPISDYKTQHTAAVALAIPFVWARVRALWSRIRHRRAGSVEGYRFEGMK